MRKKRSIRTVTMSKENAHGKVNHDDTTSTTQETRCVRRVAVVHLSLFSYQSSLKELCRLPEKTLEHSGQTLAGLIQ